MQICCDTGISNGDTGNEVSYSTVIIYLET